VPDKPLFSSQDAGLKSSGFEGDKVAPKEDASSASSVLVGAVSNEQKKPYRQVMNDKFVQRSSQRNLSK
jgi:hypothetical protein